MQSLLQQHELFVVEPRLAAEERLRAEAGWTDVGKGLGRILLGYSLLIAVGVLLAGWIVLGLLGGELFSGARGARHAGPIMLLIGGLFLGVACLLAYGWIIAGNWSCLLGAPERYGARWFMFSCLLCTVAGPALNMVASFGATQSAPRQARGVDDLLSMDLRERVAPLQCAGGMIGLAGSVLFVLFLRSVALCFGNTTCLWLSNLYLGYTVVLGGGMLWLEFTAPRTLALPLVMLGLAVGWLVNLLWYLLLLMCVRACILQGVERLRSPLDWDG